MQPPTIRCRPLVTGAAVFQPSAGNVSPARARSGSVLIIVMWIALGLVAIALYFANSMTYELRASDNRVAGLAADQAIEGAARYVTYILSLYATNGAVPLATNQFLCADVPAGDAHFWLIGRDPNADDSVMSSGEPCFGLVDEGSKLNLNTVNTNVLSYLPGMTTDFANAILDWRSTNGVVALDYASLGYYPKNAPFETEDELRLVYGATEDLLVGGDLNRNGVLDANETTAGAGDVNFGLFEYTTVWTREPNFQTNGAALTNINQLVLNSPNPTTLTTFLQNEGVGNAASVAQSLYASIRSAAGVNPVTGLVDLAHRCWQAGMSESDFGKIYDDVTTSTNSYLVGRVNVNTAGLTVLTALFEGMDIDQQTALGAAQTLIAYRQQNPNNLNTVWWLMDALGNNHPVITALTRRDWVTTRSYQFTADIAAVGPYGRGYRRVKFIFDTSNGSPIIIYRQDLSRLGWALGDQVRQTLLANNTTP